MPTNQEKLARVLGQSINERDNIRANQVRHSVINNYFVNADYRIRVKISQVKVEYRTIGDAFILGHSTNGELGAQELGDSSMGSWTDIMNDQDPKKLTNVARNQIAAWLNNESPSNPSYLAIGTGTTAYSESQTALVTETDRKHLSMDISTTKQITLTVLYSDDSTQNVTEIGLFDASTSGNMWFRDVFSEIDFSISNQYRWTIVLEIEDASVGNTIVVDEGLNEIRNWIGGSTGSVPTHTEWNDATTSVSASHTSSDWDSGGSNEERNVFQTQSRVKNQVTFETILSTAELTSVDIFKSGNFDAGTNGTLFGQIKYGQIAKSGLFQVYEYDKYTISR